MVVSLERLVKKFMWDNWLPLFILLRTGQKDKLLFLDSPFQELQNITHCLTPSQHA